MRASNTGRRLAAAFAVGIAAAVATGAGAGAAVRAAGESTRPLPGTKAAIALLAHVPEDLRTSCGMLSPAELANLDSSFERDRDRVVAALLCTPDADAGTDNALFVQYENDAAMNRSYAAARGPVRDLVEKNRKASCEGETEMETGGETVGKQACFYVGDDDDPSATFIAWTDERLHVFASYRNDGDDATALRKFWGKHGLNGKPEKKDVPPVPTPAALERAGERFVRDHVPDSLSKYCSIATLADQGDEAVGVWGSRLWIRAQVQCTTSDTPDAPVGAVVYTQFREREVADRIFTQDIAFDDETGDCEASAYTVDDRRTGYVRCGTQTVDAPGGTGDTPGSDRVRIAWTYWPLNTLALADGEGTDTAAVHSWWLDDSGPVR